LLASAIAAILVGRRANNAVSHVTAPTFMALTCRWRSRPQHQ
jgi:hypothetical protein